MNRIEGVLFLFWRVGIRKYCNDDDVEEKVCGYIKIERVWKIFKVYGFILCFYLKFINIIILFKWVVYVKLYK